MSLFAWQITTWVGILMTVIGGFGSHLFAHFSGRSLESYCRLKRKRERYGEVLDLQEQAATSSEYVFLAGATLAIFSATIWLLSIVGWKSNESDSAPTTLTAYIAWSVIAGMIALLMLVRVWLPRIMLRDGATVLLFHTWIFWKLLARLTRPLTTLADFFSWIGHRLSDDTEFDSFDEEALEDDIQTLVAAGERDGLVGRGIREMIQGVMNLDEGSVSQIMTPRSLVDVVDISLPLDEIIRQVDNFGRTRLPVYEGSPDNIIGILFVKDLFRLVYNRTGQDSSIRGILRDVWRIPGSRKVNELLRDFLHKRNHMAVVVDDYHQFIGVVTIEDALEEIVGEIADELDVDEQSVIRIDEQAGAVDAEGRASVDHLNRIMGWKLPISEDYDTIAGLVISTLGEIPLEGKEIQVGDIRIEVRKATSRQIRRVRLVHSDQDQDTRAATEQPSPALTSD
jgi:putative hemolysin